MATDHARRQLKADLRSNEHWYYQDRAKNGFTITRDALKERMEEFKLRKGKG